MPVYEAGGQPIWRRFDTRDRVRRIAGWFVVAAIFAVCAAQIAAVTQWSSFVHTVPRDARDILGRMVPPDWAYHAEIWRPLWDTITIATLGTLIAVLIAVPVAVFAARTTTPHPLVRGAALVVIAFSRSINSLIWALLFITLLYPGVLAGICAIVMRSIGFVAKLLFEAIEEIDPQQVEAIRATGAGPVQVVLYGIVPQIMPAFVGIAVFRWDINIRESTVVGLVGAGGIGLLISASMQELNWQRVSLILLVILALVILGEWISATIRKRLI